jgi:hypothetical protein
VYGYKKGKADFYFMPLLCPFISGSHHYHRRVANEARETFIIHVSYKIPICSHSLAFEEAKVG